MTSFLLASGRGWRVEEVRCTSGPCDRPFEEQHDGVCIAIVTGGTFTYRTSQGTAVLASGAALLGNHGHCFECGHEHGTGDSCLSFRFTPELVECVASELPGARQLAFTLPNLPPLPQLIPLVANAAAARDGSAAISFEELALSLVAEVKIALAGMSPSARGTHFARHPSPRDQRRITDALRRIEARCDQPLSLQHLATEVAMSPYHFLRTFRAVAGISPHQYLLHTRLQRAAVRLSCSSDPISAIALEAGFSDLSTFNRRFRRLLGASPSAYRATRQRTRGD
ncbi:MAG: helix-turn-helix domain-containing protein [Steroidobacteraceae bacterium]